MLSRVFLFCKTSLQLGGGLIWGLWIQKLFDIPIVLHFECWLFDSIPLQYFCVLNKAHWVEFQYIVNYWPCYYEELDPCIVLRSNYMRKCPKKEVLAAIQAQSSRCRCKCSDSYLPGFEIILTKEPLFIRAQCSHSRYVMD